MTGDESQSAIDIVFAAHPDARAFAHTFTEILHFYDDVADGDVRLTAADAERAVWQALVLLPRNPFYRAHFDALQPLVAVAVQNWRYANACEAAGRADAVTFIVRSSYVDVLTYAAMLCGIDGGAAASNLRAECHGEGLDGYRANLDKQREDAARLRSNT